MTDHTNPEPGCQQDNAQQKVTMHAVDVVAENNVDKESNAMNENKDTNGINESESLNEIANEEEGHEEEQVADEDLTDSERASLHCITVPQESKYMCMATKKLFF